MRRPSLLESQQEMVTRISALQFSLVLLVMAWAGKKIKIGMAIIMQDIVTGSIKTIISLRRVLAFCLSTDDNHATISRRLWSKGRTPQSYATEKQKNQPTPTTCYPEILRNVSFCPEKFLFTFLKVLQEGKFLGRYLSSYYGGTEAMLPHPTVFSLTTHIHNCMIAGLNYSNSKPELIHLLRRMLVNVAWYEIKFWGDLLFPFHQLNHISLVYLFSWGCSWVFTLTHFYARWVSLVWSSLVFFSCT